MTCSIRICTKLHERLKTWCKAHGTEKSAIINALVMEFLDRQDEHKWRKIPTTEDFQSPKYIRGGRPKTAEYISSQLYQWRWKWSEIIRHIDDGFKLMALWQQGGENIYNINLLAKKDDIMFCERRPHNQIDNCFAAFLARPTGKRREISAKDSSGNTHSRKDAMIYETLSGIRFGVLLIPGDAEHYEQTMIVLV